MIVGPLTLVAIGIDGRLSVHPVPDDVTSGLLLFHSMSGADAPPLSVTSTDSFSDCTVFSSLNGTGDIADGFFVVGEEDEIYKWSFLSFANFFKTCLLWSSRR